MIFKNIRDQEAWLREKSIESLKQNAFLKENNIVQVAETGNFYKVVTHVTDITLQNGLFAQLMPSKLKVRIEQLEKNIEKIANTVYGSIVEVEFNTINYTVAFDIPSSSSPILSKVMTTEMNESTPILSKRQISGFFMPN